MNSRRRGQSATRAQNLTTAEVIARFTEGPTSGVFTDGSCSGNPGPGGWGAVRVQDGEVAHERHGFEPDTTNNRMELTEAIEALASLSVGAEVRVVSDSRYVIDGITKWVIGWKKRNWRKSDGKPVLNQELWQRLDGEVAIRKVSWQWVEGHTGHPENERCDELANLEMDRNL